MLNELWSLNVLISLPHLCVWVIACMWVEQAGGTEQLQTFNSDEDDNEEYMRTRSIVDEQNQIFVKMQH